MTRFLELFLSAALLLMTGVTYGQTTAKADNAIEVKIHSLVSQMTQKGMESRSWGMGPATRQFIP